MRTSRPATFRRCWRRRTRAATARSCTRCTAIRTSSSPRTSAAGCCSGCSITIRRTWRCCARWWSADRRSCSAAAIPSRCSPRSRPATASARSTRCRIGWNGWSGSRPKGAWLTERVWESSVVPALADAGIEYVTVDDYHFLCTGQDRGAAGRAFLHRGGRPQPRAVPDLRGVALPHPVLPGRRSGRLHRAAGREPPGIGGDLLRRHREVRHLARRPTSGCTRRAGCSSSSKACWPPRRCAPQHFDEYRAAHAEPGRGLPADHLLHRDERVDAAGGARARLRQPGQAGAGSRPLRARQGVPARRHLAQLPVALQRVELDAQAHAGAVCAARCAAGGGSAAGACASCCTGRRPTMPTGTACSAGLYLPHLRRAVYNAMVELEGELDRIAAAAGGRPPRRRPGRRRGSVPAQRYPAGGGALRRRRRRDRAGLLFAAPQLRRHAAAPRRALLPQDARGRAPALPGRRHRLGP